MAVVLSVASMREPTNCDLERLRDVSNREPLSRGPNDERDMRNAQAFFGTAWIEGWGIGMACMSCFVIGKVR